eukprot:2085535-Prymnesium_polylepis.1
MQEMGEAFVLQHVAHDRLGGGIHGIILGRVQGGLRLVSYGALTYALLSPPPGRSPWPPVPRVGRYGIGVDPSKRPAPGFAVSGDGGVDPGALRPSHHARR